MSNATTTTERPTPTAPTLEVIDLREPHPVVAPPRPRRFHLRGVRLPIAAYVASRVLVLATAAVTVAVSDRDLARGPWPRVPAGPEVLRVLGRWDSAWYLGIARHGYPSAEQLPHGLARAAFFPLLPLLVRIGSATGLPPMLVGLAITTLAGGGGIVLLWRLVDELSGRRAANRAAALVSFFPGAFALSMVYSEGLLLLGAAGCFLALYRRSWVWAGVAAAVAVASRPTGAALLLACAWAAVAARERRALAAPAIASVGLLAYAGFLWRHAGSATLWLRSEHVAWHDEMDLGRATLERVRVTLFERPALDLGPLHLNPLVGTLGLVFALVALVLLWQWRPPAPVAVYAVTAVGMAVVSAHVGPRPRMLLAAFPLVAAVGVRTRGKAFAAVLTTSAVLLVVLSALVFTTKAATP